MKISDYICSSLVKTKNGLKVSSKKILASQQ